MLVLALCLVVVVVTADLSPAFFSLKNFSRFVLRELHNGANHFCQRLQHSQNACQLKGQFNLEKYIA